jgi:3,4-dihydroxy 2-butanone 4-phosphate synthase/GTP cyclohydrolase II
MDSSILAHFKNGGAVVVMDDVSRENEGDLVIAGEFVTEEQMTLMIRHTTGIICAPMTEQRAIELGLPRMCAKNTDAHGTQFTVSVDAKIGTSTGVSSHDRTQTIHALADKDKVSRDFRKPGHIFPLVSRGIMQRQGHTEAGVAICELAGLSPVAVISELVNDNGTMMRLAQCSAFALKHNFPLISVGQIANMYSNAFGVPRPIPYASPKLVSETKIHLQGYLHNIPDAKMQLYRSLRFNTTLPDIDIVVVMHGNIYAADVPLRIHSECLTGDAFSSARCDCGAQLHQFLAMTEKKERGILVYIRGHEGRGIGLKAKLDAYRVQQSHGLDTVDANLCLGHAVDARDYADAVAVLEMLEVKDICLYSNNPEKRKAMEHLTLRCKTLETTPSMHNYKYLETKRNKCEHKLSPMSEKLDGKGLTVGIVYTSWHKQYVRALVDKCVIALEAAGAKVKKSVVPGAYELVTGAKRLGKETDAVVCIGVLLKGQTDHYDYIASAVSQGIMQLNVNSDKAFIFGVLTCTDEGTLVKRTVGELNIADEWARTAIHMCDKTVISQENAEAHCTT